MKKIFFVMLSFFIIAQTYASAQPMPWQKNAQKRVAPAQPAASAAAANGSADMESLSVAIRSEDINLVKRLVTRNNVNIPDEKGIVPLYVAAKEGSGVMVKLILEQGADINHVIPSRNLTALCAAAGRQNVSALEELLKHKADANKCAALTYLVSGKYDTPEYVSLLIKSGANVNLPGYMHATPLMLAAAFGKPKSVKVLLENKANPNAVAKDVTPLSAAFMSIGRPETLEVIELLVQHGATLSAANAVLKPGTPLWQNAFKAADFPTDKRQDAENVINYINELASGKPHKAIAAKQVKAAKPKTAPTDFKTPAAKVAHSTKTVQPAKAAPVAAPKTAPAAKK